MQYDVNIVQKSIMMNDHSMKSNEFNDSACIGCQLTVAKGKAFSPK